LLKTDNENYRKRAKSPKLDLISIDSIFAKGLSELIHKEFNTAERRQMIEEIKNGHFATRKQVIS